MMNLPSMMLMHARRTTFWITWCVIGSAGFFGVVLLLLLLQEPSLPLSLLFGIMILDITIGTLIIRWMPSTSFTHILTLLTFTLGIGAIVAALLFPEAKPVILTVFMILILLSQLGGSRSFMLWNLGISIISTIGVMLAPPISGLAFSLGGLLPFIQVITLVALFIICWITIDRQFLALTNAFAMVQQRVVEAEEARHQAEDTQAVLEERNAQQAQLLDLVQTLEVPILFVTPQFLVLPLVGHLDTTRMDAVQTRLLHTIATSHATTVVVDLSGIVFMDTRVAQQVLHLVQGITLLGARPLVSGIQAAVARQLSDLRVHFPDVTIVRSLGQALEFSLSTDEQRLYVR